MARYLRHPAITARIVASSRPGDVLTESASPGLRLHVGQAARSWIYRYATLDRQGRKVTRQVVLGRFPTVDIAEARKRWHDARQRKNDGVDLAGEIKATRTRTYVPERTLTVRDVCTNYLREHVERNRAVKAIYEARRLFDRRVFPVIGDLPAESIDVPTAVRYLIDVRAESLSSARVLRAELRAAWRHAMESGRITGANPFSDIMAGKLPQTRRTRYLNDSELCALLRWLLKSGMSNDVQDALKLTLYTAARSGEVIGMRWRDIDSKGGAWTLAKTKTDVPRTVRLPKQAMAILAARRRTVPVGEEWVFPSPIEGRHLRQHALVWSISNYRESLKIDPWSAHDLRRSARTGLARIGVSDVVCEAALGHTRGGIAGTYDLHHYEGEVGAALQRWCDHLDALRDGGSVRALTRGRA